jgi:nucleoside-diphosphate-sugar epimerase
MILVTGATGLVGSHLLFKLTEGFDQVNSLPIRALFRSKDKLEKVKKLFTYYDPQTGRQRFDTIRWKACDVLDIIDLQEAFEGISKIYHCAAEVSFQRGGFSNMFKTNREGTFNVVNCALDIPGSRLVFVSSTAAVSRDVDNPDAPLKETNKWVQQKYTSKYAITKYSSEKEVWRGIEEGLDAVIINPSMVIGAGDWNQSSLTILKTIEKGLKFYTLGENAFVDARDVADAMVLMMQSQRTKERYLVTGTNISFKEFFSKIALKLGKKPAKIYATPFLSGVVWRLYAVAAIFGVKPTITRETAASAHRKTKYDSSKFTSTFNFSFRDIDDTIKNAVQGKIV